MTHEAIQILLVDDDVELLAVMEVCLRDAMENSVRATTQAGEAVDLLANQRFDLVITDYSLGDPEINGLDILRRSGELQPDALGIIVTAYASLEISLDAIRLGAYDFLTKPFQLEEFRLAVRNAAERVTLNRENLDLRSRIEQLAESAGRLKTDQDALVEQLRLLDEEGFNASIAALPGGPSDGAPISPARAYRRMAETLGEQIERHRRRIEELFEQGLISEPVYRKWLANNAPAPLA